MKTGIADLPLHYGKCPKWLFDKMKILAREISEIIICEYGKEEFLRRISDPFFFQSFGCIIGYDWHSSGLTTTLTAALKEAKLEDLGIYVFGGKGSVARKVPEEIEKLCNFSSNKIEELKKISRIVAKVDNCLIQDGFSLYHHCFIVSENGDWSIVQQGMDTSIKYARRYHWLSENLDSLIEEPHKGIVSDIIKEKVLDLTSKESRETRKCMVDLINDGIKRVYPENSLVKFLKMPAQHFINIEDYKELLKLENFRVENFEELILIKNVGLKAIRALALTAHLIYGTNISWKDPAKYSFAHGGKDHTPYKIDRKTYNNTIKFLNEIIEDLKIGKKDKIASLKKLSEQIKI